MYEHNVCSVTSEPSQSSSINIFDKYNKICEKVNSIIKKEFNRKFVYTKKYRKKSEKNLKKNPYIRFPSY